MGGETLAVVLALRLAEIMVSHTVEEDHQDRPGHEEQGHQRKWVYQNPDAQRGLSGWYPGDRIHEGMLSEMVQAFLKPSPEYHHATRPG